MATDATPGWWVGITVSIVSNVVICLALNCQKLAHMRLEAEALECGEADAASSAAEPRVPLAVGYLQSRLWWLGFALMCLGEAGNFVSYGFAPASLIAPLGAVSLLSNVVIAPVVLHETVQASDVLGIALAIVGAVAVVSCAGPSSSPPWSPAQLGAAMARPTFVTYSALMLCLACVLMYVCSTPWGQRSVLAHVGVCAVFGGFTVLATKGISSFLVLHAAQPSLHLLHEPLVYGLVVVLASTAVLQLVYLNRALQHFDARQVIPTQFVVFTISTIVGSSILYRDFAAMAWGRVVGFVAGILGTFLGVFVLSRGTVAPTPVVAEALAPTTAAADDERAPLVPMSPSLPRAYTAPDVVRPLQRSRQRLAQMTAVLVGQSQSYLGSQPIPSRTHQRHRSETLGVSEAPDTFLRTPASAFLGISPGRNLLAVRPRAAPEPVLGAPGEPPARAARHRRNATSPA